MTTELIMPIPWSNKTLKEPKLSKNEHYQNDLIERALQELREDEHTREACLEVLKQWIDKNEDIVNCYKDDCFLLRFLRVKKYSIPMAQQTLLKYLNFRRRFREFMYNMDFFDNKVSELFDNRYITVSPFRDSKGRRIILYNLSKFDPQKYDGTTMAKAHAITYEALIEDEETQILGVTHVADLSGITPSFLTLFSIADFATIIRWGEQSFPMRHKEIHFVNIPPSLRYVYEFAKTNMSQKIRDRIVIHESFDDLFTKIDRTCLSREFGGELDAVTATNWWKKELESKRQRLLSFDKMDLLSDRGIIRSKNVQKIDDFESLPGSFRQLQVD